MGKTLANQTTRQPDGAAAERGLLAAAAPVDGVWSEIRSEVQRDAAAEPMLASFLHQTVLNHRSLEDALSFHLSMKLGGSAIPAMSLREVIDEALADDPALGAAVRADLIGVRQRDPACRGYSTAFLNFKGFQALQAYRIGHWLWEKGRVALALHLQSRIAEIFAVDIHPAARIGKGVLMDHATGVVIGETAVIEDNVSMLHEVTLGGTGKETGDRHPKVRQGVMIGAGAKILGNVEIGEGAKIAAGSVVLRSVKPNSTVAGVPARLVGAFTPAGAGQPAFEMDQWITEYTGWGDGI